MIVAFESRRLLRDCLASLREHRPRLPTRIFVVDNGSDDGTPDMVLQEFPEVDLDVAAANLGFSRANNRAITRGTGKYVLALNPDTRVGERGLDALLALMESHPEIGICGCRLQLEDGSFDHAARRSFPTPLGALAHFTGIGRRAGAPARLAQYRAPEVEAGPVDAVNGAFMLMRRSALDQVGLFDEGYWMYMEDLDLCYRFKQAGWVVWYEPNVTVAHIKGASSGAHRSPRLNYAFHYGMFRFYRKHYAADRSRATNGLIYSGIALKLAVSVLHSAVDRRLMPHLRRARPPKVG